MSLLPLRCCDKVPIDMNICHYILSADDVGLKQRIVERKATNKMYCPSCNKFINLDYGDAQDSTELICICVLCIICKFIAHPHFSCIENRAIIDGDDTLLLEVAQEEGWKQCPKCNVMIELSNGCNHISCSYCDNQFCFQCLLPWGGQTCSSGACEVWDETRLLAAGEARVEAKENARQMVIPAAASVMLIRT